LSLSLSPSERYIAFFANDDYAASINGPSDFNNVQGDQNQWASFDGDKVIANAGTVPGTETATISNSGNWIGLALSLKQKPLPVTGYLTSWLAQNFPGTGGQVCSSDWSVSGTFGTCDHHRNVVVWNNHSYTQPPQINDIAVNPTGTVFTNGYYDEGSNVITMLKSGSILGGPICMGVPSAPHGGWAATSNRNYVFVSFLDNAGHTGVVRLNFDGTPAPFSGGTGICSTAPGNSSSINIETRSGNPQNQNAVWGMAASSTELYVSDRYAQAIKVYTISTMALNRTLSVSYTPARIAYNPNDNTLWVAQMDTSELGNFAAGGASFPIHHLNATIGADLNQNITAVKVPTCMAMNSATLLICDAGPDMQIKQFNASGSQTGTLGVRGGMISGTSPAGSYVDNALDYPIGLAVDGSGNIYVAEMQMAGNYYASTRSDQYQAYIAVKYGSDIRSYNPSFTLNWKTLSYMPLLGTAAADPASDAADVFDWTNRYRMDYSKSTGGEAVWAGNTTDLVDYPDDSRNTAAFGPINVVNVGCYKYVLMRQQGGGPDSLFTGIWVQKPSSNILRPMFVAGPKYLNGWADGSKGIGFVQLFNNNQGSIWNDSNGDGIPQANEFSPAGSCSGGSPGLNCYMVDSQLDPNGDLWVANQWGGVSRYVHSGPDSNGVMTFSQTKQKNYSTPFSKTERAWYVPSSDTLYVSGWTGNDPGNEYSGNDSAGNTLNRYDHVESLLPSGGTLPPPTWSVTLPYGTDLYGTTNTGCSKPPCVLEFARDIQAAGNYVFVIWAFDNGPGENPILFSSHYIQALNAKTGIVAGNIWPGPEVNYWSANWHDNMYGVSVYQRTTDGQYLVFDQNEINGTINLYRGLLNNFSQY
jgi:hypothetical protein